MNVRSSCRFALVLVSVAFALSLPAGPAAASPLGLHSGDAKEPKRIPGRYIVVFKDSVANPRGLARALTEAPGRELGFVYRHALRGYSAALSPPAVEALRSNPRVAYIEPDTRGEAAAQTVPTGIERILALENENLDIDEEDDARVDVDVAVLDGGVDDEHPDLDVVAHTVCEEEEDELQEAIGLECVEETGSEIGIAHGTHVAGTIAAIDNGYGVVGVAPGARIWSVRVLDSAGSGSLSEYIAGIDWVTEHADEIEVANSSLQYPEVKSSKAFTEAMEASVEAGLVHVVAAGNTGKTAEHVPAISPDALTVSALADYDGVPGGLATPTCADWGEDDTLASFSSFGAAVDVAAPGACILSTLPGEKYGTLSGTSMAAPQVAAAAAVLASIDNPDTATDVESIRDTITIIGQGNWTDDSSDGSQEPLLDMSREDAFGTAPPAVATSAPTGVKTTEAMLRAKIEQGEDSVAYLFEYGTSESYELTDPFSWENLGPGSDEVTVSELVEDLKPGITYHFRVKALGKGFRVVYGEDLRFTTKAVGFRGDGYGEGGLVLNGSSELGGVESWENRLNVLGTDWECVPPDFATLQPAPSRTLSTEGSAWGAGVCHDDTLGEASEPGLEMNGCRFNFEPGEPLGESSFDGGLSIGPAGCGPIETDLFQGTCHMEIDPADGFSAGAVYENHGEGTDSGVNVYTEVEELEAALAGAGCGEVVADQADYFPSWEVSAEDEQGEPVGVAVEELATPVASYSFDEAQGEAAHDFAGDHDGALEGGAARVEEGRFGSAIRFEGSGDRVRVPDTDALDLTGAFTLEAWVNPDNEKTWRPVISKGDGIGTKDASGYLLFAKGAGAAEGYVADGETFEKATAAEALPAEDWSHLALSSDGEILRLYVDGEQVAEETAVLATDTAGDLEIGHTSGVLSTHFEGLIDEVRLYDVALPEAEIEADAATPIGNSAGLFIAGEESEEEAEQPRFEGEGHPLQIAAEQDPEDGLEFSIAGSPVPCGSVELGGGLEGPAGALTLSPQLSGCTSASYATTVEANSCAIALDLANSGPPYTGSASIACAEEGDQIEFDVRNGAEEQICLAKVPAQSLGGTVDYENLGEGPSRHIHADLAATGMQWTRSGLCLYDGKGSSGSGGGLSGGLTAHGEL